MQFKKIDTVELRTLLEGHTGFRLVCSPLHALGLEAEFDKAFVSINGNGFVALHGNGVQVTLSHIKGIEYAKEGTALKILLTCLHHASPTDKAEILYELQAIKTAVA